MEEVNGEESTVSSSHKKSFHAPWHDVPKQLIVSVEHPFIIKDVDKGLATLGSPSKLEAVRHLHLSEHDHLMLSSWSKKMALPLVCI